MVAEDPSGFEESASIEVDVVLALPGRQWRKTLVLPTGSSLQAALDASGIAHQLDGRFWSEFVVGVFGRIRTPDSVLADGDRVELYRPLTADPKEARRLRALRRAR